MSKLDKGISIIIPCYNEGEIVVETLEKLYDVFKKSNLAFEIFVINDASTDDTGDKLQEVNLEHVIIMNNQFNLGYGASIKVGMRQSRFDWIGITDADGTYPVERFADFFEYMDEYDMIVGTRTGKKRAIPFLRRPAKWFLNKFSSYLVQRKIKDVNSGMRLFKKDIALKFWKLFPDGFSFTTTLTLAMMMGNFSIKNLSIDYFKRKGRSKIHPIKDFNNFILLIVRITMMFNPLRVFLPIFFFLMFLTLLSVGRDIYNLNMSDTTVMIFIFSIVMMMIGLLADLINRKLP
jgi:glycosyltransferase involved in cell wall biosynthesis